MAIAKADPTVELARVEALLHRLYIASGEGGDLTRLREEDLKKAREISALLVELARVGRRKLVVDAAAGHAYAGLCAAEILGGIEHLVVIERDARRSERALQAAARLSAAGLTVEGKAGDVGDPALWPHRPDVVLGLHACGSATDAILDAAARAEARWLFVVPCCYSRGLALDALADSRADDLGLPRHAEIRRRFIESIIDAERVWRLESAGYEVTVLAFVPPTVTPHNRLFRARRINDPNRMRVAVARREKLLGSIP